MTEYFRDEPQPTRNPVIGVLEDNRDVLVSLHNELPSDPVEQNRVITERYGPLADRIVEEGDFSLEPSDLIDIWEVVESILPDESTRYLLAGVLGGAYAIQGLDSQKWKRVPRYMFESGQLLPEVRRDLEGLTHVINRLGKIAENLNGTKEMYNQTSQLPLVLRLSENIRNGISPLFQTVQLAIARLGDTAPTSQ